LWSSEGVSRQGEKEKKTGEEASDRGGVRAAASWGAPKKKIPDTGPKGEQCSEKRFKRWGGEFGIPTGKAPIKNQVKLGRGHR